MFYLQCLILTCPIGKANLFPTRLQKITSQKSLIWLYSPTRKAGLVRFLGLFCESLTMSSHAKRRGRSIDAILCPESRSASKSYLFFSKCAHEGCFACLAPFNLSTFKSLQRPQREGQVHIDGIPDRGLRKESIWGDLKHLTGIPMKGGQCVAQPVLCQNTWLLMESL